jgi:hypothetical protein
MYTSDFAEKIRSYLENEISLRDLEDWYTPRLRSLLHSPDSDQAKMIGEIELGMVEIKDQTLAEKQLKTRIRSILSPTVIVYDKAEVFITMGSTSSGSETRNIVFPCSDYEPTFTLDTLR